MATIKKHKNVLEKIDSYIPVEFLTEQQLLDNDFLITELGDAIKVIKLIDNPFNSLTLNIMIDIEDLTRSQNFTMDDSTYKEFPIENDTPEMNEVREATFERLEELVEEGILRVEEEVEVIAPTYRKKKE